MFPQSTSTGARPTEEVSGRVLRTTEKRTSSSIRGGNCTVPCVLLTAVSAASVPTTTEQIGEWYVELRDEEETPKTTTTRKALATLQHNMKKDEDDRGRAARVHQLPKDAHQSPPSSLHILEGTQHESHTPSVRTLYTPQRSTPMTPTIEKQYRKGRRKDLYTAVVPEQRLLARKRELPHAFMGTVIFNKYTSSPSIITQENSSRRDGGVLHHKAQSSMCRRDGFML